MCSAHGKTRRKEIGYKKAVRVCDQCRDKHEYVAEIQTKPLGLQLKASEAKTYAIVVKVKKKSAAELAKCETDSVIIEINDLNVESLPYDEVLNMLHSVSMPISIRFKVRYPASSPPFLHLPFFHSD